MIVSLVDTYAFAWRRSAVTKARIETNKTIKTVPSIACLWTCTMRRFDGASTASSSGVARPPSASPHQSHVAQYEICPLRLASDLVGAVAAARLRHTFPRIQHSRFVCFNSVLGTLSTFVTPPATSTCLQTSLLPEHPQWFQRRCFNHRIRRIHHNSCRVAHRTQMATRRAHNKTRLGCHQCKKRRIKVSVCLVYFRVKPTCSMHARPCPALYHLPDVLHSTLRQG